jgi:hypothetical protein
MADTPHGILVLLKVLVHLGVADLAPDRLIDGAAPISSAG